MKMHLFLIPATLPGMLIVYIDTRPHWNNDGISVLMLLAVSVACGYFAGKQPWLTALFIGVWTPLFNIVIANNYGSLLALLPAAV